MSDGIRDTAGPGSMFYPSGSSEQAKDTLAAIGAERDALRLELRNLKSTLSLHGKLIFGEVVALRQIVEKIGVASEDA